MPFFRNIKPEINLIVDISSHSVGAALVDFAENKPAIIISDRLFLPISKEESRQQLENSILEHLDQILEKTIRDGAHKLHLKYSELGDKKIEKILCVMASPWVIPKISISKKNYEKTIQITDKALDEFLKDEATSADAGSGKDKFYSVGLEKILIQTKLNGYPIKNPAGRKAHEIEAVLFESRANLEWLERVEKLIYRRFHRESFFHSHILSTFTALEKIFPENKNYLLTEITGETTEITLIEDGGIKKSFGFDIGKNVFLRNISQRFNVDAEVALSFLKLYEEKGAEQKFNSDVGETVRQAEESWRKNFTEFLMKLNVNTPTIFLSVDTFFAPSFKRCIENKNEKTEKYTIINLDALTLGRFLELGDNSYDPILALSVLFLRKIHSRHL